MQKIAILGAGFIGAAHAAASSNSKLLELAVYTDQFTIQNVIPLSMLLHIAGEIFPSSNVWHKYMFLYVHIVQQKWVFVLE